MRKVGKKSRRRGGGGAALEYVRRLEEGAPPGHATTTNLQDRPVPLARARRQGLRDLPTQACAQPRLPRALLGDHHHHHHTPYHTAPHHTTPQPPVGRCHTLPVFIFPVLANKKHAKKTCLVHFNIGNWKDPKFTFPEFKLFFLFKSFVQNL